MTLVFGGAFNPPTLAHRNIILHLQEKFPNQTIVVLPVGDDYRKPDLVHFYHRYAMLERMVSDLNHVVVSKLESLRPYGGTLKSLDELSQTYPKVHFVIGSDNLMNFRTWINYETLLAQYPFIVIHRHGFSKEQIERSMESLKHTFIYIPFDEDISSTKVRQNIDQAKDALLPSVYQYIIQNHLYQETTHV